MGRELLGSSCFGFLFGLGYIAVMFIGLVRRFNRIDLIETGIFLVFKSYLGSSLGEDSGE